MLVVTACESGSTSGTDSGSVATMPPAEQEPPPDLSNLSYVDNLLAKEANGEWSRGEGLIATLGLFAGEIQPDQVLRHPELLDYEATGIVWMARDYLDDDPDPATQAEIVRLLDLITFSSVELDAMAGVGPPTASLTDFVIAQSPEEDCAQFFSGGAPAGVGACLQVETLFVLDVPGEGPYRIFRPAEALGDGGWTERHYELAREAMSETVPVFSTLEGEEPGFALPPVNLVFSVSAERYAMADPVTGQPCGVVLYTKLQEPDFSETDFKQIVAHELGHCFQTERFAEQNAVEYEFTKWREEGVAEFLGNLVYPTNDLEWNQERMQSLTQSELTSTLFDRSYTNSLFFQHMATYGGIEAVFSLVDALPANQSGLQAQKDALAAIDGIFEAYHDFVRTVTDEEVLDSGETFGPYAMSEINHPTLEITGPGTILNSRLDPFGLIRRHLIVEPGKQACLTWDDADLIVEHRPHPQGEWVPLTSLLPLGLEASGNVALAVTARRPGSFSLVVSSVHDLNEETDGEIVATWIVDNASMRAKIDFIAPVQNVSQVSGQIRVTFRNDGTVHVAYDDFTVSGSSHVVLQQGAFSTNFSKEYTSVTNAEGVDNYRVSGDYVFYDSLSESDFLEGTETVSQTSSGTFLQIETDDHELVVEMPEDSVDERPPNGWALVGAANELNFTCGGQILLLDDIVLRRAG